MEGQAVIVKWTDPKGVKRNILGVVEKIARKRGTNRRYAKVILAHGEGMTGKAETEAYWIPLKRVKRIGWSQ